MTTRELIEILQGDDGMALDYQVSIIARLGTDAIPLRLVNIDDDPVLLINGGI